MPTLSARGVELAWEQSGDGPAVVLLHETGTGISSWAPLREALGDRARSIAYDRRGWGASTAPEGYRATTIEEQAEDAAAVIEESGVAPAVLCGTGIGAIAALDLLLGRPDLTVAAVLVEPPLLGLVPEATEAVSRDRNALERAVADGGIDAAVDAYRAGALNALGPGAERLPSEYLDSLGERTGPLFAEIAAPSAWRISLPRLAGAERPSTVVFCSSTPPLLRAAAESLAGRLAGSELRELDSGAAAPQHGAPADLAELVLGRAPAG
ncbi:MAG: alpha/beta hydrolase [Solirubrobacterales bacterium]|nr:alpha/beta hydrolase [Solirubrobacterales bacterium]